VRWCHRDNVDAEEVAALERDDIEHEPCSCTPPNACGSADVDTISPALVQRVDENVRRGLHPRTSLKDMPSAALRVALFRSVKADAREAGSHLLPPRPARWSATEGAGRERVDRS